MLISVSFIQLAHVEIRVSKQSSAQSEAKSNARLALMMAIAQLQEMTGSDQIVTAKANLLSDSTVVENPNWVGVWKTTYAQNTHEISYPLIGKRTQEGDEPYAYIGNFSDLRSTEPELTNNQWRSKLLDGWLVSSSNNNADPLALLSDDDSSVIELFGRGSLGSLISLSDYEKQAVRVGKINIFDEGAIAWWTSDNNQKACILPIEGNEAEHSIASALASNPGYIKYDNDSPFIDFHDRAVSQRDKIISMASLNLPNSSSTETRELMKYFSHDLTHHAPGMYTNPVLGGFQRDLTPLLFANSNDKIVTFTPPSERISEQAFHSDFPIISSYNHDVLAPTFSALRYWGLQKYITGNTTVTDIGINFVRMRSNENWPYSESDGATYKAQHWAEDQ